MTYWSPRYKPQAGHADIPDHLREEFHRMRSAFMDIDQNNVLADGIDRDTITRPDDSAHEGLSDVINSAGGNPWNSQAGTVAMTTAIHNVWQADTDLELEIIARQESVWMVGYSAEFAFNSGQADHVRCDLLLTTTRAGVAVGRKHGILGESKGLSIGFLTPVRVPSGKCTFKPLYRGRWHTATNAVDYKNRFLWAFGLYRV